MKYRSEQDGMGKKKIPANALYGINTARSSEIFSISGKTLPFELFHAIAEVKIATAHANFKLKILSEKKYKAITKAAEEVAKGKWDDQFLIDAFQSGAGTPTHMNVNEVIANRALELMGKKKGDYKSVHPNNDVNAGQSTNNVFPTAIKIVVVKKTEKLTEVLKDLEKSLKKKSNEFRDILKSGRTHLQDAVPITLGQEFQAYATSINKNIRRLKDSLKEIYELNIGKNAVGTGINTYPSFTKLAIQKLKQLHGIKWTEAKDPIYATSNLASLLTVAQALQVLVVDLNKIANDLRLLNSGPKAGLNEITLPHNEAGSSIMPGKVNPNIAEMLNMVCFHIMGNNETVNLAVQAGQLELNVMMPLIANSLLDSFEIGTNAIRTFDKKCIQGIKANKEVCEHYFESSLGIATLLNPYIGYENATKVVEESIKKGESIREVVLEKKLISKKDLDRILDYRKVTRPNLGK